MPIIQAPAHELDILDTVVKITMHVASSFARVQKCADYKIGSSAYVWNFLKVIGQHMQYSGLKVMWVEIDLLRGNTIYGA